MVEMYRFYFNDLTYPRKTVSDMIEIAYDSGFYLHGIKIEPPKYREKVFGKINDINNFWLILKTNFPSLNLEEMFSGIYHIVFKKV